MQSRGNATHCRTRNQPPCGHPDADTENQRSGSAAQRQPEHAARVGAAVRLSHARSARRVSTGCTSHGEVAALRDALQEGLSISSAVSRAREALRRDTNSLVGALDSFELRARRRRDGGRARAALARAHGARRSCSRLARRARAPHTAPTARRGPSPRAGRDDWLRRAQRLSPAPARNVDRARATPRATSSTPTRWPSARSSCSSRARARACLSLPVQRRRRPRRRPRGASARRVVIIAGANVPDDHVARWAYHVRAARPARCRSCSSAAPRAPARPRDRARAPRGPVRGASRRARRARGDAGPEGEPVPVRCAPCRRPRGGGSARDPRAPRRPGRRSTAAPSRRSAGTAAGRPRSPRAAGHARLPALRARARAPGAQGRRAAGRGAVPRRRLAAGVCALSRKAEDLLGVPETRAVNRHVSEFLTPADAEAHEPEDLLTSLVVAATNEEDAAHGRRPPRRRVRRALPGAHRAVRPAEGRAHRALGVGPAPRLQRRLRALAARAPRRR